ncbi:hypothetical protein FQN49_000571 [Arthroderma sp. PD_2]|nr:hypothetical protein FQN49_000571 [Arthroderma sp. PD_2]
MASHLLHTGNSSNAACSSENADQLYYSTTTADAPGVSLADISKTNNFTSKLPPDAAFDTPLASHKAPREHLGPRLVRHALYTFVRPEEVKEPELLGVSPRAMKDIGLKDGEHETEDFRDMVAGNKIFWNETDGGVYPWAQCYGGWQFGSWAGQLGDGRAISLFETVNPATNRRYEVQLKGAGLTPYSRFADGKAVLRSSIREFIVSEALNALGIPTTRALSLTLLPNSSVRRERLEPGAIVTRFAESWIRIGTFDLLRSRSDLKLTRQLAIYVAEDVFPGWESLPAALPSSNGNNAPVDGKMVDNPPRGVPKDEIQGEQGAEENRFVRLYREIVRRNAKTVAAWQAYGFMNGVLNTDNTSIFGLSLDFGPFAFMDNFDPSYTPNHDDEMLRYSYKNQPSVIWWNLVRLGEAFSQLIGIGDKIDDEVFISKGVTEEQAPVVIARAEKLIEQAGEEFKTVFLNEYKRLMSARLGLTTQKESDFSELFSNLLDTLEKLELDFNHFFRKLSAFTVADIDTDEKRKKLASVFFHDEGVGGIGNTEESARENIATWLSSWRERIVEDWKEGEDEERIRSMMAVNPKFVPRSWILDEVIQRVEKQGDREILGRTMNMALHPFQEEWGVNKDEEERFCGDVPRFKRMAICGAKNQRRHRSTSPGTPESLSTEPELTAPASSPSTTMNRFLGRTRRSDTNSTRRHPPAHGRGPTNGFVSSDAESFVGTDSEAGSIRRAGSNISNANTNASSSSTGNDEAEILRRAFEESLILDSDRRRQREEADREARNREEEVRLQSIRDSEEASRREQEAAQEEDEALKKAAEASKKEERRRARRERAERRNIRRLESSFGAEARPNGVMANTNEEMPPVDGSMDIDSTNAQDRRVAETAAPEASRATQSARPSRPQRWVARERDRARRAREVIREAVQLTRDFASDSRPESARHNIPSPPSPLRPVDIIDGYRPPPTPGLVAGMPIPPHLREAVDRENAATLRAQRRRREIRRGMEIGGSSIPPTVDPTAYSLEEIITRSRNQAYPDGPFTEQGQESNYDELQRAINESAEQHRDEEEEAVQRNRGIPTYEEACSSQRYRPRPGMRYSFQGPEVIEIENEGKPPSKLKIVGDMDLGEAMRVANQRNKKKRDVTQLN